jgi:hypothetical protein
MMLKWRVVRRRGEDDHSPDDDIEEPPEMCEPTSAAATINRHQRQLHNNQPSARVTTTHQST